MASSSSSSFVCTTCNKKYMSKQKLKKHEEIHVPCSYCGQAFETVKEKINISWPMVCHHRQLASERPPAITIGQIRWQNYNNKQ